MRRSALLLSAVALFAISLNATVIKFDNLPDSTIVTNQYQGVTLTNAIILTAGISLDEYEFPPHSGTNVISDHGGPLSIGFATPVTSVSGYFTYAEPLTLTGFNSSYAEVTSSTSTFSNNMALSGFPGSSPNEQISVWFASGLSSVTITGDSAGNSFVLDDLTYSSTTTVPEPSEFIPISLIFLLAYMVVAQRRLHKTLVSLALSLFCGAISYAQSISALQANPSSVFTSTASTVTVTAQIAPQLLIPTSVNIVRYDSHQSPISVIGQMYDDGTHGDATASDGVYTGQVTLKEMTETVMYFRVSAAYRGKLNRTLSDPIEVDSVNPLAQADLDLLGAVSDSGYGRYEEYIRQGSTSFDAQAKTITWLTSQLGVSAVGPANDNGPNIWIAFSSGILGGLYLDDTGDERGGGGSWSSARPPSKLALMPRQAQPIPSLSGPPIGNSKVAAISPFDDYFGNLDEAQHILHSVLNNTHCPIIPFPITHAAANLDAFRNMGQYGAVLISSHGDTWFQYFPGNNVLTHWLNAEDGVPVVMTREEVPLVGSLDAQTTGDLKSGRVIVANHFNPPMGRFFAFTSGFVDRYYSSSINSIVYIGSCRSLKTPDLAAAFTRNGASTFFGYTEYVSNAFAFDEASALFLNLVSGLTTGDAFAAVNCLSCKEQSPNAPQNTPTRLAIFGSSTVTLPNTCSTLLNIRNDNGQPGSFLLELPEGQPPFAVSIPNNSSKNYDISDLTGPGPFTLKIKATAGFASIIVTLPTGFQFMDGTTQQGQYIVAILTSISVATFNFEKTP